MPLFQKKPQSKGGAGDFLPWHPNFRNQQELPDTKAVRTKFFLDAAAALLCLSALLFWLYQENLIKTAERELEVRQEQIQKDSAPSKEAVRLYKAFKDEERKVAEFHAFLDGERLVLSDLIVEIGEQLPPDVHISAILYKDGNVSLKGVIKGVPELATGVASSYEKALRENAFFGPKFANVTLTSLLRDPATGFQNFDISLKGKK